MRRFKQYAACFWAVLAVNMMGLNAQVEAVTKKSMTIQRRPVIAPPQLSIVEGRKQKKTGQNKI